MRGLLAVKVGVLAVSVGLLSRWLLSAPLLSAQERAIDSAWATLVPDRAPPPTPITVAEARLPDGGGAAQATQRVRDSSAGPVPAAAASAPPVSVWSDWLDSMDAMVVLGHAADHARNEALPVLKHRVDTARCLACHRVCRQTARHSHYHHRILQEAEHENPSQPQAGAKQQQQQQQLQHEHSPSRRLLLADSLYNFVLVMSGGTGWTLPSDDALSEAEIMNRRFLSRWTECRCRRPAARRASEPLPPEIMLERNSTSTWTNAVRTYQILHTLVVEALEAQQQQQSDAAASAHANPNTQAADAGGAQSSVLNVLLVTSRYHRRRAHASFESVFNRQQLQQQGHVRGAPAVEFRFHSLPDALMHSNGLHSSDSTRLQRGQPAAPDGLATEDDDESNESDEDSEQLQGNASETAEQPAVSLSDEEMLSKLLNASDWDLQRCLDSTERVTINQFEWMREIAATALYAVLGRI
jgi:hypothetical protein